MNAKKLIIGLTLIIIAYIFYKNFNDKKNVIKQDNLLPQKNSFSGSTENDILLGDLEFKKEGIHIYNINFGKETFDYIATFGGNSLQGVYDEYNDNHFVKSMQCSDGFVFSCKKLIGKNGNKLVLFSIKNINRDFSISKCVNLTKKQIS